ncbi:Protein of unknown function [Gryllus bimaculatus]|nr:Protein of unknown function [Gryllus bimaculatus]
MAVAEIIQGYFGRGTKVEWSSSFEKTRLRRRGPSSDGIRGRRAAAAGGLQLLLALASSFLLRRGKFSGHDLMLTAAVRPQHVPIVESASALLFVPNVTGLRATAATLHNLQQSAVACDKQQLRALWADQAMFVARTQSKQFPGEQSDHTNSLFDSYVEQILKGQLHVYLFSFIKARHSLISANHLPIFTIEMISCPLCFQHIKYFQ